MPQGKGEVEPATSCATGERGSGTSFVGQGLFLILVLTNGKLSLLDVQTAPVSGTKGILH